MKRVLRGLLACLLVLVALLAAALYWPAADWLPRLLPATLRAENIEGSLLQGSIERLYLNGQLSGPWQWQLRGPNRLHLRLGDAQQGSWQALLSGWPWDWRMTLSGGDLMWLQGGQLGLAQGRFSGELQLAGDRQRCRESSGELLAPQARLALPALSLGETRLRLECGSDTPVYLDLQRPGQHDLHFALNPERRRGHVEGELQPGGELSRLASDWGLIAPGQRRIEQPLNW